MKTVVKTSLLIGSVIALAGCAGTLQTASVLEAYKKFDRQQYEKTLVLITRAENARETTPEMKAELTYLKAQAYEKLDHQEIANTLFKYLAEQHQDSQYGYLASKKFKESPES